MLLCLGCQVLLYKIKCHIRTKYLMSLKCSAIRLCLSIELFSCKFDCKMQSTPVPLESATAYLQSIFSATRISVSLTFLPVDVTV